MHLFQNIETRNFVHLGKGGRDYQIIEALVVKANHKGTILEATEKEGEFIFQKAGVLVVTV
jgi:hypothetical protein